MNVRIICPNPNHLRARTKTANQTWVSGKDKSCGLCGRPLWDEPLYIDAELAPWSEQVKDNSQSWGYVITNDRGHPVWVGHPERTREPTITVYDTYAKARRRLTAIYKGTLHAAGEAIPMRITPYILFESGKKGPLITPKLRKTEDV